MDKLELTNDAIVSIDAIRHNAQNYKAEICDAFSNTVFLADMVGNIKKVANCEMKEHAWQVIKTLAAYSDLISGIVK